MKSNLREAVVEAPKCERRFCLDWRLSLFDLFAFGAPGVDQYRVAQFASVHFALTVNRFRRFPAKRYCIFACEWSLERTHPPVSLSEWSLGYRTGKLGPDWVGFRRRYTQWSQNGSNASLFSATCQRPQCVCCPFSSPRCVDERNVDGGLALAHQGCSRVLGIDDAQCQGPRSSLARQGVTLAPGLPHAQQLRANERRAPLAQRSAKKSPLHRHMQRSHTKPAHPKVNGQTDSIHADRHR